MCFQQSLRSVIKLNANPREGLEHRPDGGQYVALLEEGAVLGGGGRGPRQHLARPVRHGVQRALEVRLRNGLPILIEVSTNFKKLS